MPPDRYIRISEEEMARLRLIRAHEGNDLSPNDEALLDTLASRYQDAEEGERVYRVYACEGCDWISTQGDDDPDCDCDRDAWGESPPEVREILVTPVPREDTP